MFFSGLFFTFLLNFQNTSFTSQNHDTNEIDDVGLLMDPFTPDTHHSIFCVIFFESSKNKSKKCLEKGNARGKIFSFHSLKSRRKDDDWHIVYR